MSSFSIPLTGLQADEQALDSISNNLANMNTNGFKDQTTNFSTLFFQNLGQNGSGDPLQVGQGVQVASTSTNFSEGAINNTGIASDAAISGDGFFTVEDPTTGQQLLTQDGSFSTNQNGNLVTSNGLLVLGFPITNGVANPNGALVPIVVPVTGSQAPQATQNVTLNGNLDATAPVGTNVPFNATIFDSLGNSVQANVSFTSNGGGSWSYAVTVPGAIGNAASTGTLQFNSSGQLVTPAGNIGGISFTGLSATGTSITAPPTATGGTPTAIAVTSGDAISGALNLEVTNNTDIPDATPTTPSATAGSSVAFTLGSSADTISGPFTFSLAGGAAVTVNVTGGSSLSSAEGQLNAAFGANGMTASVSGDSLIVTGPAGTGNTLSIAGTALVDTPLPTAVTATLAAGTTVGDAVNQLNGQTSFTSAGLIASQNAAGQLVITGPAGANNTVSFVGTALTDTPPGTLLTDGAAPLNFSLNLFGANGTSSLTQTASVSVDSSSVADGNAAGIFQSFAITSAGIINATFSNSQVTPVGQLAISTVNNEEGLTAVGGNDYQTTLASGQSTAGAAGTGTRGTVEGSNLEGSNVDISTEFANLIVAQNAFDANSKSITTFDSVQQDALNMLR